MNSSHQTVKLACTFSAVIIQRDFKSEPISFRAEKILYLFQLDGDPACKNSQLKFEQLGRCGEHDPCMETLVLMWVSQVGVPT